MILIVADAADLAAEEIATKYRHRKIPVRGFFIPQPTTGLTLHLYSDLFRPKLSYIDEFKIITKTGLISEKGERVDILIVL